MCTFLERLFFKFLTVLKVAFINIFGIIFTKHACIYHFSVIEYKLKIAIKKYAFL